MSTRAPSLYLHSKDPANVCEAADIADIPNSLVGIESLTVPLTCKAHNVSLDQFCELLQETLYHKNSIRSSCDTIGSILMSTMFSHGYFPKRTKESPRPAANRANSIGGPRIQPVASWGWSVVLASDESGEDILGGRRLLETGAELFLIRVLR